MDITDAQRRRLGEQIAAKRLEKYGSKSAAYRDANINSGTWDRIENGLPVRGDRLAAAVKLLWPASRGDWRNIPEGQESTELEDVLAEFNIPAKARDAILAAAHKDPPKAAPRRRKAI